MLGSRFLSLADQVTNVLRDGMLAGRWWGAPFPGGSGWPRNWA